MPWIRPLLLTALLASVALPGHATEGPAACTDQATGADSDEGRKACAAAQARPQAPQSLPAPPQALDCSPFTLGALASGTAATGIHASAMINATIRHCSLRGYFYGVAMLGPTPTRADTRG